MTVRSAIDRVTQQERLNFLLTNRLPRRWLTLFMGWLSQHRAALALPDLYCDLGTLHRARPE